MLCLAWSSIQTTKDFSISAIRLFCFLTNFVFTGVAHLISFKNCSFAFGTWLTDTRGPAFGLSWLLTYPGFWHAFLTKLNHFCLLIWSERYATLPSTWTLRGHCRDINWPNFNILVSQRIGRPKERKRNGGTVGWWST